MRFAPFAALLATLALAASPHAARAGFDPIFADGFETGDTLRWSTETGDPSAPDLPPDPESVAPPLDLTVATSTAEALEFLWTGPDPIQRDVQPGALEPRRLAALRGRVLWVDGEPLAGVRVSIHSADEVGWTFSRRDGLWDLAINGGGAITVVFEKDGFIPAQRTLDVDWRAWEQVEDVVLLQYDPVSTPIVAGATEMQVARGSVVTDDAGERQATLMFPEEIHADMAFADGDTTPLTALTVRATEYTVGPLGPLRMPAPLPENTGYTYAVELSVDEAVAAGAVRVQFDQPVAFYLENYLDFPVGDAVPAGYYDRELAQWIPSENGRIVEILSVDGGVASLDVEGAGIPASPAELDELGVSPSELVRLALLYPVGAELWRVPITHFTPWDWNWPWGPPEDANTPSSEPDPRDSPDPPTTDPPPVPPTPDPNEPSESTDESCEKAGSIIECHNQVLREEIPLVGAPWFLAYSSERVKDRGPSVYSLPVVLTGPGVSSDLIQVRATVTVAGKRYQQTFPPNPNLTWTISWDGRDLFGRPTQGTQPVVIVREYVYRAIYYSTPRNFVRSFSRLPSGSSFIGSRANRTVTVTSRTVSTISRRVRGMGNFDVSREGLGGWSLSVHHRYDPGAQVVFRGDGTRRDSRRIGPLARRFAGNGQWADSGDGGPAVDASLLAPKGLAAGPDGSIYIADAMAHRIRRVLPDGTIETVAGNGTACDPGGGGGTILGAACGDGGLATEAQLSGPKTSPWRQTGP